MSRGLRLRAPRLGIALVTVALAVPAAFAAGAPAAVATCANESVRENQHSTYLPDCRGYERASPAEKNGQEVNTAHRHGREVAMQAGASAARVAYMLSGGEPHSESAGTFIPELSESPGAAGSGWLSTAIAAESQFAELVGPAQPRKGNEYHYFSRNLECGVETTALPQAEKHGGSTPLWPSGESTEEGIENIYTWDVATDTKSLVTTDIPTNPTSVKVGTLGYFIDGASENCQRVIFEASEEAYDKPGSPTHSLYEWTKNPKSPAEALQVASILPSGKVAEHVIPSMGGIGGSTVSGLPIEPTNNDYHQISSDGSKVFFGAVSDGGGPGESEETGHAEIYLREQGSSAAREVSGPEEKAGKREGKPDLGASYEGASANGERVFFIANYGLAASTSKGAEASTFCSTQSNYGAGCDLYEYNTATNTLADLSPDAEGVAGSADKKGANVRSVLAISEGGDYVYFASSGQLVAGKGQPEAVNESKNEVNVYAEHEGHLFFVSQLGGTETFNGPKERELDAIATTNAAMTLGNARVSQNGQYFTFTSTLPLTGYNNEDKELVEQNAKEEKVPIRDVEFFEYHLTEGAPEVVCISCNPTGERPGYTGGISKGSEAPNLENYDGVLATTVLNDGRSFFQSSDALVPQAVNTASVPGHEGAEKALNVYEWTPLGSRSCSTPTEKAHGCIELIDSGSDPGPTYLIGSSLDGANVYVTTYAQLAPGIDRDGLRDAYDVRENGGFLPPAEEVNCEEPPNTGCQGGAGNRNTYSHATEARSGTEVSKAVTEGKSEVESFKASGIAVAKHSTKGATLTLVVSVPAGGRLTVSGGGLAGVKKTFAKAGRYTVKVSLAAKGRTAVRHHHKVKSRVKIAFAPKSGKASSVAMTVTFR